MNVEERSAAGPSTRQDHEEELLLCVLYSIYFNIQ